MTKKYFKTIITFEVLSQDKPWLGSLEHLAYDVTEGDCSGQFLDTEIIELSPDEARLALINQGSDPGFFGLDDGDQP